VQDDFKGNERLSRTLNLGVLAHVDAGKTTLSERLLYAAGCITELGSVDAGTTQTDSLSLEQSRGITIRSAVATFVVAELTVNLVDTPGHPDFIAEVDRVLGILDGCVLVVSAVEGVQPQTRVLMRALRRLAIPTLIFVNKIDRPGADEERVLGEIEARLSAMTVPMGTTWDLGTKAASFQRFGPDDAAATTRLAEALAEHDERILGTLVTAAAQPSASNLTAHLAAQTRHCLIHPVFFGSAITGAGIDELMTGIAELLGEADGDPDAPIDATAFKLERGERGDQLAYVRVRAGTLRVRDRVHFGEGGSGTVTSIKVCSAGADAPSTSLAADEIGKVWGLRGVRVGDAIGASANRGDTQHFAPPTLETVVVPRRRADRTRLHAAIQRLAEEDPLINLRFDESRDEIAVSLYGEVQKEVLQATLAGDFGLDVSFRETTTIYVERVLGSGESAEFLGVAPNPFLATVGLRVAPAPSGTGVAYDREPVVLGLMPIAFFRAVEDTARETLAQGLFGWEVIDCTITMTHAGYLGKHGLGHQRFNKSISSTGEDYRKLTPLVVVNALRESGTEVCEPIHHFTLEAPSATIEVLMPTLKRLRARTTDQAASGAMTTLHGDIPAGRIHELQRRLPSLTQGDGVAEFEFARYERVSGPVPTRPRSGPDPRDRREYLLGLSRRGVRAAQTRRSAD
jgi:ribosomal protection tetracycline resistance protein